MSGNGGYRELEHSKPRQYEEDGLTVTRSKAWTAPGCHIDCDINPYTDEESGLVRIEDLAKRLANHPKRVLYAL